MAGCSPTAPTFSGRSSHLCGRWRSGRKRCCFDPFASSRLGHSYRIKRRSRWYASETHSFKIPVRSRGNDTVGDCDFCAFSVKILNGLNEGDVVFDSRVDTITMKSGKKAEVSMSGMFELDEAGKIKVWHDYFNLATFTRDFLGLLLTEGGEL